MNRPVGKLALIAFALLAASPTRGQVSYPIDDFEVLSTTVNQVGAGWKTEVQVVPAPYVGGHIISTTREILCSSTEDNFAQAQMSTTTSGTDQAVLFVPTDAGAGLGEIWLTYPLSPGGIDLTVGGAVDRIEIDAMISGQPTRTVECRLTDTSSQQETVNAILGSDTQFEVDEWLLADFSVVDVTDVTEIELRFHEQAIYEVREIRLRGQGSNEVLYTIHQEATFIPPLPGPPIEISAIRPYGGGPLYGAEIAITQAFAGFTPELQLGWGTYPGLGGDVGNLLLDWTDLAPFEPLEFTLDFDFVPRDLFGQNLVPEIFPPDPIHGPEGVALRFPMRIRLGEGGPIQWESEVWINMMPGPDQAEGALEFAAASVTPNGAGWTDGFSIWIALLPGAAGVETIWPVMEMSWWSDWTIYVDPTDVALSESADAGPRLVAAPSVTRTGTTIRSSRPFDARDRLVVHDLAGRRVTTLPATSGARMVDWDGRGPAGPAAPGVYFVRLEGRRGEAARVVKLR